MTPRRENAGGDEDEDLRAYEIDGWRVGYEVEMNGIGFVEPGEGASDNESDFSDSENESVVGSDNPAEPSPYAEYQTLPLQIEEPEEDAPIEKYSEENNVNFENSNSTAVDYTFCGNTVVTPSIREEFQQMLQETSSSSRTLPDEVIPHVPTSITLDSEKIQAIRSAMSTFTLAPPPHMVNLDDHQLSEIIKEKIRTSGV